MKKDKVLAVETKKPGDTVFCKKRTRWHRAKVIAVYATPRAVKIEYDTTFEQWILRPEEVKTKAEVEAIEKAERDAQAQ